MESGGPLSRRSLIIYETFMTSACFCCLGALTLWLGVYHRNARAIRFYESRGFRQIGERDFPFGGKIFVDPVYAIAVDEIRFPEPSGLTRES